MSDKTDYSGVIDCLAELQKIDSQLYDIRSEIASIPDMIAGFDAELAEKMSAFNAAESRLKELQLSKGKKELEMKDKEEKVKKHEGELYQIKNNKEYTALQSEIESIKADISLLEEDLIRIFDEIENAKADQAREKDACGEEAALVETEKRKIEDHRKELEAQVSKMEADRKVVAAGVDEQTLYRYERILKNKGRTALAEVKGAFCGECNMQLRPQVLNDVKIKRDIVFCENCARILYAKD
ncbi:MAG: C4-type zinc ribbon domain-containing protein [Candidatus Omnitrophica bacterium]|nr:C4-type zinc ribbon domain-containing protein [Candidatus Omnitrophota bacterium]